MTGAVTGSTAVTTAQPRVRRWREAVVTLLVAVLVTGGACLQLFAGEDIGLSDQGDGPRLMCPAGVMQAEVVRFERVQFDYVDDPQQACLRPEFDRFTYITSASLLVRAWVALDPVLSPSPGYDLRTLALMYAVLLGLAFAVLYRCLPGRARFRLPATVGAAVFALDVGLLAFFASPFSEPAGLIGLILTLAAVSAYLRADRARLPHLLFLGLAVAFTVSAKLQLLPLALLVVPVLLLRRVGWGKLRGRLGGRVLPAVMAGCLAVTTLTLMRVQGEWYREVNTYNVLFTAVLPEAPDPTAELTRLGLPADWVKYSGTHYWSPGTLGQTDEWRAAYRSVKRLQILTPALTSPQRATELVRRGVVAAEEYRPPDLTNRPDRWEQVQEVSTTGRVMKAFHSLPWVALTLFWILLALGGLLAAVRSARTFRSGRGRDVFAGGVLVALLALFAGAEVVTAVLGDGYLELQKHTTFAGASTGLVLGLLVGWGVGAALSAGLPPRATRRAPARGPAAGHS